MSGKTASINLWSAMTSLASTEKASSDKAKEVTELADSSGGFGNELELTVNEHGQWSVRIFSTDIEDSEIELTVDKRGGITVRRKLDMEGLTDERRISF